MEAPVPNDLSTGWQGTSSMSDQANEMLDLDVLAQSMSSLVEATLFFDKFHEVVRSGNLAEPHARYILNAGLRTLMLATQNNPSEGEEVIRRHLLPICLQPDSTEGGTLSGYELRMLLVEWIEQYADEDKIPMRKRILADTQTAIAGLSGEAALRTISAIGFLTPSLDRQLQILARRTGPLGDLTVNVLAGLAPEGKTKDRIVKKVLRRLRRHEFRGFTSAIWQLADPRFLPVLTRWLGEKPGDAFEVSSLLGQIADQAPHDKDLQKDVWTVFKQGMHSEALNSLVVTGNGIALCNTVEVVPSLLGVLENRGAGHYPVYTQLKDCVRPEQLAGWNHLDKDRLKGLLTPVATLCTGNQTRSMTIEDHLRGRAWETALSAGITAVDDWLSDVLKKTSSPFERKDALSFASCLRLETWPELIDTLVRSEIKPEHKTGEPFLDRMAAIQVLYATGAKEAFRTLLNTGITIGGSPLRSTSETVADLAARIAKDDLGFVLSQLFALCESKEMGSRRMIAVAGFQRLADAKAIPAHYLKRLATVAQDDSLPPYATAGLIWSLGCFPGALNTAGVRDFLLRTIDDVDVDLEVKFQSFQALVHLQAWSAYRERFIRALELEEGDGVLRPTSPRRYQMWQGFLLAQLGIREPDTFLVATKIVLAEAQSDVVHAILRTFQRTELDRRAIGIEIGKCAIERTLKRLGSSFGETDMFSLIAALAPEDFINAEWEQQWNQWMPEVKAALADELQRAAMGSPRGMDGRLFEILEKLLADSAYQVRRAAARSYSRLSIERLLELSDEWIRSGQIGLRIRVAELAQWFPPDNSALLDNTILRQLKIDPEPSVRKAAARSRKELHGRVWRTGYLERIRSGDRIDGNKWVAECFCLGRALAETGDDESLRSINELRSEASTPPNVRNWLGRVAEELEQRWRKVTRDWPEPGLPWSGQLEVCESGARLGEEIVETRLTLWRNRPVGPSDPISWGGGFQSEPFSHFLKIFFDDRAEPVPLSIEGRAAARIWLNSMGPDGYVTFVGTGTYPEVVPPT
jgi:hypothetical protein